MKHELPDLPYASDALAPHISPETLSFHHGKHHQSFVGKLNELIAGTEYEPLALEEIIRSADGGVFNNAAQHWNHSFYWNCLGAEGGGEPTGALGSAIEAKWGSFAGFREAFTKSATTLFGAGWCWLVKGADGELSIEQTQNAGCPITAGRSPLLTCDGWEHA